MLSKSILNSTFPVDSNKSSFRIFKSLPRASLKNSSGLSLFSLSVNFDSAIPSAFLNIGEDLSAQILSIFFAASASDSPSFSTIVFKSGNSISSIDSKFSVKSFHIFLLLNIAFSLLFLKYLSLIFFASQPSLRFTSAL